MKSFSKIFLACASLVLTQTVLAASISLVSKEPDTAKGIRYVYSYTCSRGVQGNLTVFAQNDSTAEKLANGKARHVCEEI